MIQQRPKIAKAVLSGWALILATVLLFASFIVASLAAMNAEDFDRPMNAKETALALLPLIPAIWLGAILIRLALKTWQAFKNKRDRGT
jgi:hypothetical protein